MAQTVERTPVHDVIMQPMLGVVAAEEGGGGGDKIHLAVSLRDGPNVQLVLPYIPSEKKVVLVHIYQPATMIPTSMGATVHASLIREDFVHQYREEQKSQVVKALEGYLEICSRAKVQADILLSENDNVAAGLLQLIGDHKITTLIIIGVGKNWINGSRRNLAAALQEGADSSCTILLLRKGNLISLRKPRGSVFTVGTNEPPSSESFHGLSCSSNNTSNTLSSFCWDSRSTFDSFDPAQLDDSSLENAASIFDDTRFSVIFGHEPLITLKGLVDHPGLAEHSQDLHQAFHTKCFEIFSRCQFIGGIDSVLGVDCENFEEEYWKSIKSWPAALGYVVRVLNTSQMQHLKQNRRVSNGFIHNELSEAMKEPINRLLSVALIVSKVKRSPEKLFCVLFMYTALMDATPTLRKLFSTNFVSGDVGVVLVKLKDSVKGILHDLKVLIQNYSSQKVVQDGSILLITGYLMKYIRLLVNHTGSLDTILGHGHNDGQLTADGINTAGSLVSGLVADLNKVLQQHSKLYVSEGLRCIFLMNNVHFIIQEVEQSDIRLIVGVEWLKKHHYHIKQYMRDYLSASWKRVISHLAIAASPPHKRLRPNLLNFLYTSLPPLQGFTSSFDETCKAQMNWKVPSPVLRNELRVSILQYVVHAYHAYLESLEHSARGTAADLEPELRSKVSELFEG